MTEAVDLSLRGELRYGLELATLTADRGFLRPKRRPSPSPVLLVPGFMAGDRSLSALAGWLGRRGSRTASAGMWLNVDCGERTARALETAEAVEGSGPAKGNATGETRPGPSAGHGPCVGSRSEPRRRVVVIGQSRGGELARVIAVRNPDLVGAVVMLGSPVLDPLRVGPNVLRAVRAVARLGDLGVPGTFSSECADGPCCAAYRADLQAPLPRAIRAVSIYSRSDGIVSWQACLDRCAEHVEVDSSHSGMSVNPAVYRVLADILDEEELRWNG
jgi:pimeloyl-ACP methyl ester carboxylesterase